MSEMVKTQVYVGVAIVLGVLAVFWKSGQVEMELNDMVGKALFAKFTNADTANNLSITNYDTNFDKPVNFQVTRDKKTDQWVIPSEDDYPADAEEQMQKAVTALIDLEVVDVASEVAKDHELYGVLEPTTDVAAGTKGVGMLVEVADEQNKKLAHLIIGKQDANNNELRFVRIQGEDVTYVVKLDLTNFTTEFSEWIEEDLLALNPLDIRNVALKDYAILDVVDPQRGPIKQLIQRSDTAVAWNQEESKWAIGHLHEFKEPNKPTPTELSENEELNSERLNELKNALDDLKIVGVKQKPADTNQIQLQEYGFYPFPTTDENNNKIDDVRSANGEVHVSLQDGIQYILRFGDIVPLESVKATAEDSTDNIYRYLVVAAKLDKSQIAPPELEPEPKVPATPDKKPEDAAPAKEAPKKPADPAPAKKAPQDPEKKSDDPGACDDEEKQATDEKKPADDKKSADAKKPADQEAEKKPADEEAKPAQPPADEKPAVEPPVELTKEQIEKIAEGIRKENERKLNEYQEKIAAAEKRVQELNSRFANWCFIIDEKVYNQIHLSQTDVIKEKEEADLGDFRNLDPQNPGTPPPGANPLLPNLPPQP